MFGLQFVWKYVCIFCKAFGRAVMLHYETVGFIMAKSYLPDDETSDLIDPELAEYQRTHPNA